MKILIFSSIPERGTVYENYGGVRVGVNKTNGKPGSVFPDGSKQLPVSETPPIVKPNNKDDEFATCAKHHYADLPQTICSIKVTSPETCAKRC